MSDSQVLNSTLFNRGRPHLAPPTTFFSDHEHPVVPTVCSYEQPVVDPHVSHFMQVPLRTSVKLPHSPQGSPS